MPVITQITTHQADAQARLLNQFKDKTLIEGLLDALTEQVQDFEDAAIELNLLTDISTMEGAQLDGIGTIVGKAREGLSDTDYRAALEVRIAELYSSGTPEDVIDVFKRVTGATNVLYTPDYPAGYDISGDGTNPGNIVNIMAAASPAGVEVGLADNLVWEDDDNAITEDSDNLVVIPASS